MSIQVDSVSDGGKRNHRQVLAHAGSSDALPGAGDKFRAMALAVEKLAAVITEISTQGVEGFLRVGAVILIKEQLATSINENEVPSFDGYTLAGVGLDGKR